MNRNVRAYIRAPRRQFTSHRNELVKMTWQKMDNEDSFKPLDHINKIAELVRSLTYSEMIELASELRKTAGETVQIDKIAELIRSLTYGEMIGLASGLREAAGEMEITAGTLPIILHRWACEHGK
jgi:hypothetical protein